MAESMNGFQVQAQLFRALSHPVRLRIRLSEGEASGWMLTSDLSHGYIDINAHYRT